MSIIKYPKVILTGTYSSFNKGDAAMQVSTAEQIKEAWPNAEIIISAPFPDYDHKIYKDYKLIKSTRRNLPFATLQIIRAKIYTLFKKIGFDLNFIVKNEELSEFKDADIIIDLSGDTLTEDYGPHVTYSHFLPIWLGLSFKKPVFICAQSIGPFKLTRPFSRHMLNKAERVTAREKITYDYLASIGVNKNVELTSDMAFLLKPASKKRVEEILKQEKVNLKLKEPNLAVTVSDLVVSRFNQNNPDKDLVSIIANLLDNFIEENGASVMLLGHVTGPSESKNDRLVANKIKQNMKHKNSAYCIKGDYSPGELKGLISRCDIMMGSRMHSNIAALSSCVPTLAIGYSHKTLGIMKLFGMEKYVVNIDKLKYSEIFSILSKLNKGSISIENQLKTKFPTVKSKSQKNVKIIDSIIKRKK